MSDIFSPTKRSRIMAAVRSHGNRSTELRLIALMRLNGITGWRRSYPLFGRPDFSFPKERVAVFVDGVFWHGHPRLGRLPSVNRAYWRKKITRNRNRDRQVNRQLRLKGWQVARIWESDLRHPHAQRVIKKLMQFLGH